MVASCQRQSPAWRQRNRRYFIDSTKSPFSGSATPMGDLPGFGDEAAIVDNVSQGLHVLATVLAGGGATVPTWKGEDLIDNDPSSRMKITSKGRCDHLPPRKGLIVRIGLLHIRNCSTCRTAGKATPVGRCRYKHLPNIVWSIHGNVDNPALIAMVRGDGGRDPRVGGRGLIRKSPIPLPKARASFRTSLGSASRKARPGSGST
jgi:hypothetical protein